MLIPLVGGAFQTWPTGRWAPIVGLGCGSSGGEPVYSSVWSCPLPAYWQYANETQWENARALGYKLVGGDNYVLWGGEYLNPPPGIVQMVPTGAGWIPGGGQPRAKIRLELQLAPEPAVMPLPALNPFLVPPLQPLPQPVLPIPPGLLPYRPPLNDLVERPERYHPPRAVPMVPRPPFRPPGPPEKGEKEKKFKTQATARFFMWLSRIMNFGTEALDFLEAVWKALPREMRSGSKIGYGGVTPQQAIRDIYDHFGDLNEEILAQALANLIENEVEDRLVGAFEREWAKAMEGLGRRQTNRPTPRVGY